VRGYHSTTQEENDDQCGCDPSSHQAHSRAIPL
jgi:hypothetical protein